MTANEQAYLKRIKQVPCLIKLALVAPPAPPPAPVIAPLAPAPTLAPTPVPAPPKTAEMPATTPAKPQVPPAKPKLVTVYVHIDGKIKYQGALLDLPAFQAKLKALAQATPDQSLVIKAGKTVPYDKVKAVLDSCQDANVKYFTAVVPPPAPKPHPEASPTTPAAPAAPTPAPAVPAEPAVPATPSSSPAIAPLAPAPTLAPTPPPSAKTEPLRAIVRVDGKVNFKGATYELPRFKSKLAAIIKANPDQAIVVKAGKTVPFEKLKAVLDICDAAQVKYLSVIAATPTQTPASSAPSTANLPAPGLLMHPSMEPTTSNPNPATTPATDNPPTTNASPPPSP